MPGTTGKRSILNMLLREGKRYVIMEPWAAIPRLAYVHGEAPPRGGPSPGHGAAADAFGRIREQLIRQRALL